MKTNFLVYSLNHLYNRRHWNDNTSNVYFTYTVISEWKRKFMEANFN